MNAYSQDFNVETKEDKPPLIEADKRVNDIINIHLIDEKIKKELLYNKENLLNPWVICS